MSYNYNSILDTEFPQLIPEPLLPDFYDFMNESQRNVVRANCVRRYIEGAIDLFIKQKILDISKIPEEDWNKKQLFDQIKLTKKYYSSDLVDSLHRARVIGNNGSHYKGYVSSDEIQEAIDIALNFFEDILVEYFSKNEFGSQPPLLTLFSSLPPIKRIYILEKLQKNEKSNLCIVEKLSMAYMKSGNFKKSCSYLNNLKTEGILKFNEYKDFIDKVTILNENMPKFDISKDISDVSRIFYLLFDESYEKHYPEFTSIFLALISGYNYNKSLN